MWTRLVQIGSALGVVVGLFAVIIDGAPSDPAVPGEPVDHSRLLAVPIGLAAAACGVAGIAFGSATAVAGDLARRRERGPRDRSVHPPPDDLAHTERHGSGD